MKIKEINVIKNTLYCEEVKSIQDITNQREYVDEIPMGKKDKALVACGQDDSYNELSYIYTTYLEPLIAKSTLNESEALKALCETCNELPHPRKRSDYYKMVEKKLGIDIF